MVDTEREASINPPLQLEGDENISANNGKSIKEYSTKKCFLVGWGRLRTLVGGRF